MIVKKYIKLNKTIICCIRNTSTLKSVYIVRNYKKYKTIAGRHFELNIYC